MSRSLQLLLALTTLGLTHLPTAEAAPRPHLRPTSGPKDTIVVRLPNQAVLTLLVRDASQLRELKKYHLDSLTTRLAGYIDQADAAAKASKSEQVTMDFYPAQDQPGQNLPEQVRVTTNKNNPDANRVDVGVGNVLSLKIKKSGGGSFSIGAINKDKRDKRDEQAKRDSIRYANRNPAHNTNFHIDLGLNAFVNKGTYSPAPGLTGGQFELRPEGSRYVNLALDYEQRLGGKNSPLYLSLGPEFAFNNYMLRGNNKWVSLNDRTEIVREPNDRQLEKSKLATSSVNLPLMLGVRLHDRRGKPTVRLAAGGFAGYLIGQHSKIKYTENGDTHKDKDRGSFNLNEFQYGLQGTLGIGSFTLFAKYNMNELFKDNRGPQANVLSFGISFWDI